MPLTTASPLRSFPATSKPAYLRRAFSTTPPRRASILFALNALSNSRETQHFNKISRLNRIEHSPPLKLIKTSEVDAYPLPTPLPAPRATTPLARPTTRVWDAKALNIGRTILADHARQTSRLQKALERAKRKEARRDALMAKDRATWQQEATRLRSEMRVAGVVILLSIGTATGLAMWRFWPDTSVRGGFTSSGVVDSGQMGRRIAARAKEVKEDVVAAPVMVDKAMQTIVPAAAAVEPALATPVPSPSSAVVVDAVPRRSWWKNLFWKQQ